MRTVLATLVAMCLAACPAAALAQTPAPPPAPPEQPPIYEEQVVVTASKVEQQLVNAPATVSVVTSDVIASSPATNYAELLRSVPGMNITQTSARDFNLNMRGATSTLSTSQLALIDGRSLYLDFFGFVAWDFLPINPNEVRQIEVIRGPASAVWGANALSGVVNFITKTPREMQGTSFTHGRRHVRPRGQRQRARQRRAVVLQRHARGGGQRPLVLQAVGRGAGAGRPAAARRASFPTPSARPIRSSPTAAPASPSSTRASTTRRRERLPPVVLGRLCRHRRHHPHRHRAVRHESRHRAGLRLGAVEQGRAEVQPVHQHPRRRCHGAAVVRPRRPADPVRVRHQDLRRRVRQRQRHRHAQRAQLRRQPPLQQLRPVDWPRAATTAPKAAPTSRTRSSSTTTCAGWSARASTSSACSTSRVLAAHRRDHQAGAGSRGRVCPSTAPSARRRSSTTSST